MKNNLQKAIVAALAVATNDETKRVNGYNTFNYLIAEGRNIDDSLIVVLDGTADDNEKYGTAIDEFDSSIQESKKTNKIIIAVIAVIAVIVLLVILIPAFLFSGKTPVKQPVAVPTVTQSPTTTAIASKEVAIAAAKKALKDAGWKESQYTIEIVDESKDKSTTGSGAFNLKNIKTSSDMIAFLKTDKDSAKALLNQLVKETKATKAEVLNDNNWVVVQANAPFNYPGNTEFKNGVIVDTGQRAGAIGDIFPMFISPKNGKAIAVRGACANPQTVIPKPEKIKVTPTPTPTLQPKSSNPGDYKKPGDDTQRDSGTGTKPIVPKVSTTPEATPPPVKQVVPGNNGIVDTPLNKPGTQTGTNAPSATPAPVVRTVPPVEPNIVPTGTVNTTNPPNPFN